MRLTSGREGWEELSTYLGKCRQRSRSRFSVLAGTYYQHVAPSYTSPCGAPRWKYHGRGCNHGGGDEVTNIYTHTPTIQRRVGSAVQQQLTRPEREVIRCSMLNLNNNGRRVLDSDWLARSRYWLDGNNTSMLVAQKLGPIDLEPTGISSWLVAINRIAHLVAMAVALMAAALRSRLSVATRFLTVVLTALRHCC